MQSNVAYGWIWGLSLFLLLCLGGLTYDRFYTKTVLQISLPMWTVTGALAVVTLVIVLISGVKLLERRS